MIYVTGSGRTTNRSCNESFAMSVLLITMSRSPIRRSDQQPSRYDPGAIGAPVSFLPTPNSAAIYCRQIYADLRRRQHWP